MDGLFPSIFHGERSELRDKYGLVLSTVVEYLHIGGGRFTL